MFDVGMKRLPLTLSSAIPLRLIVVLKLPNCSSDGPRWLQTSMVSKRIRSLFVYGVKTDKEFVNTLEDNIRERGAMDKLINDCARAETITCIKDILRALVITDWQSEPYHENRKFAENRYATIKAATNHVLNQSGAPADCWLLAVQYVCHVLNHLASSTLKWIPTLQALPGQMQDISAFLACSLWEPLL
jgi:hypothetical protein